MCRFTRGWHFSRVLAWFARLCFTAFLRGIDALKNSRNFPQVNNTRMTAQSTFWSDRKEGERLLIETRK